MTTKPPNKSNERSYFIGILADESTELKTGKMDGRALLQPISIVISNTTFSIMSISIEYVVRFYVQKEIYQVANINNEY